MEHVARQSLLMWTISQSAAITNSRTTGIAGANPRQFASYYRTAIFQVFHDESLGLRALTRLAIYGSIDGTRFPALGANAEALVLHTANFSGARMRGPQVQGADGTVATALRVELLPPWLILEYSAGAGAGAGTLQVQVRATFIGSPPAGVE